jgi:hypothetical protein
MWLAASNGPTTFVTLSEARGPCPGTGAAIPEAPWPAGPPVCALPGESDHQMTSHHLGRHQMNPHSAHGEEGAHLTTKLSAVELYILWAQRELVRRGERAGGCPA